VYAVDYKSLYISSPYAEVIAHCLEFMNCVRFSCIVVRQDHCISVGYATSSIVLRASCLINKDCAMRLTAY